MSSPLDRIEEAKWLLLEQLRDEHHPQEADDCPFCRAVVVLDELVNVAKAAEAFGMGDSEWRRVEEALAELNQEQPT